MTWKLFAAVYMTLHHVRYGKRNKALTESNFWTSCAKLVRLKKDAYADMRTMTLEEIVQQIFKEERE